MNNKEIGKQVAKEVEKQILWEIQELDVRIKTTELELPDELNLKLREKVRMEQLHSKRNNTIRLRVASFFVALLIISATVCITNPTVVTAVRDIFRILLTENTRQSLDIQMNNTMSNEWKIIETSIPKDFIYIEASNNRSFERITFQNNEEYIVVTAYGDNYLLSLDDENYTNFQDTILNGYICKIITKNNVTTIAFLYHEKIFEIASNLPENDVIEIAEKIIKED